ncbi:MAG: FxsA family protein [Sneathiella sp.]|nr:FxsA family protein [Sneathiella sp.]
MPLLFFAVFIGIPILEIFVFVEVGGEIGALNTAILTILTAIAGMALLRHQGLSVLMKAQATIKAGNSPVNEILSGVLLALAGLFLLIPGFVTDTVGFLLFLPPLRNLLAAQFAKNSKFAAAGAQSPFHPTGQNSRSPIIEGEYSIVEEAENGDIGTPNDESPWSRNTNTNENENKRVGTEKKTDKNTQKDQDGSRPKD